jgi:endo-1,4-beta-D-glucanase Y
LLVRPERSVTWLVTNCARLVALFATIAFTVIGVQVGSAHAVPARNVTDVVEPGWAEVVDLFAAVAAGQRFLDGWVVDGRVVRHDQGGDTVSEGQAYAMTVAVGLGDEDTFRELWQWTQAELQRPDGLFAWRWQDGAVTDRSPASDADLMIAGALSLAARRFDDRSLSEAAGVVADALLAHSTTEVAGARILVAGPWAVQTGTINPSYLVTPVMSQLWWDAGWERDSGWEWSRIAASSRHVLTALTVDTPHLPPDWAEVLAGRVPPAGGAPDWTVTPSATPSATLSVSGGGTPVYGWEAVRIPVQMAADCAPSGRAIAARMWPFFLSRDVVVSAVYALDGSVVDSSEHAVSLVGAAGAAWAAGEHQSSRVLLEQAETWHVGRPTYYGAAWLALARMWLTTDLLGGCASA